MKTKNFLISAGLLILIVSLSILYSCTKTENGNLTDEQKKNPEKNLETYSIDETDFSESGEDLTTVDYKEYYDQLTAHGEWLQVLPEEIGLESNTAFLEGSDNKSSSILDLFGINKANASSDAAVGMVYVWKPSTGLGISRIEGKSPEFIPYSNGQWINTDAGWYFKAPTPVEETVSHYGRWVNTISDGWLWVPGRVWAPAWVDWKENDNYVSWAPLPPSVYLVNGILKVPLIDENNYSIVERRYFLEPSVYKYNNLFYENGNRILVNEMKSTNGIIVLNNTILNKGPDVSNIQRIYKRNIDLVKIQRVREYKDVKYSDKEYYIYTPRFYRFKNSIKVKAIEPKSFKKHEEWKIKKSEIKESEKIEKELRKENNGNNNIRKNEGNDNGKKNDDNDNGKKNEDNDNGKKNDDNDNGKKNNGNDNDKKNDRKDNGNKHDGKDNGKGKK